jgi:hypothetical protein
MAPPSVRTLAILSDIHYASTAEQARGDDYEFEGLRNPFLRVAGRFHRHYIWLRTPLRQNHLLNAFLAQAGDWDYVIANGDFSCNSAFVGMSDDAARQSALECLGKLRKQFGARLRATFGDHELGKFSFFGRRGGMRLESWRRAQSDLGLEPFWRLEIGNYVLLGVVSSVIALPVYESETLPEELPEWRRLRETHLGLIREAFAKLRPDQRVLLFCHDPTALPFLGQEEVIRTRLPQLEQTIIGHLHSNLILRQAQRLAGIPPIRFLGHTARRMSLALREARHWRPFKVRLCPSVAGIELLKDGGFLTVKLDPEAKAPACFEFHPIPR